MDTLLFFLEQHMTVRTIVEDMVLRDLSDEQLRRAPSDTQNSLAWLLWHTSRCEDVALAVLDLEGRQVLDQDDWARRMNLERRDVGTGMTVDDCAVFNAQINIAGLWAYWRAVGQRTLEQAVLLDPKGLADVVDEAHLGQVFGQGIIGNERARWVEQFFAKRTNAWWLSFVIWHSAEHLFGEALCVRSQAGIALGI
jgi:hypothetical protein